MKCDREGIFKAVAFFNGFQKGAEGSRSLGLRIRCELHEMQERTGMIPWREYGQEIEHTAWIRKKDGTLNQIAAENLCVIFGWNGDMHALQEGQELGWCNVVTEFETYEGKQTLKAKYLNEVGSTGGGLPAPDAQELQEANMTLGPQLRALAANVKRNKPAATPPPPQAAPAVAAPEVPF